MSKFGKASNIAAWATTMGGIFAVTAVLFLVFGPDTSFAQTDTTAPTISSVAITSDAGNGVYAIDDDIKVTVTFSEDVTVVVGEEVTLIEGVTLTGRPRLGLDIGGSVKGAEYESTSGSTVVFSYTVAEGDSDSDGIAIRANKLALNGGTIRDAADNDANLSHDALSAQEDHEVDGVRPRVRRFYIPQSTHTNDRAFTIGDPVWIYTNWSERLYVSGNPQLTLDFGGTLKTSNYTDGWLGHFSEYTVVEGDSAPQGVAIPANAISLNGGSIRDRAGNDAVLTHSAVSAASLSWTLIPVDGIRPTITSIEIESDPGDDDTYAVGDEIRVLVTFSENIQNLKWNSQGRTYQTTIELNIGGEARTANYYGIRDVRLYLTYTVQAGDTDADGISVGSNKMWNGPVAHPEGPYTLIDRPNPSNWAKGNSADVSHDAVADDSGHKVATSSGTPAPTLTPQNHPATGQPSITGTPQATQTLTAGTSSISDTDGLGDATFAYQWIRNNGTTDTRIPSATSSTYTLTRADVGSTIKVKVSFTDDAGHSEVLTSNQTATVVAAPNNRATGVPSITGATRVAQTLTTMTTGISDQDGLTQVAYTYQWIRNDGTNDANIPGATNASYVLTSADLGKTVKVRVSFVDDNGNNEAATSNATAPITVAVNNPATGLPTITGTLQVEETLTAVTTGISDQDGLSQVVYTYQWIRNDGTDDVDIEGPTNATYVLTAADQSKFIKVRVTFNDDAQNSEALTSLATAAVAAPDTFLTGLTTSSGTLTPAFSGSTINYTVPDVANTDDQITLATTLEEGHTPIFVRAVAAFRVCSIYGEPCEPWTYDDEDDNQVQAISDADTDVDGFQVTVDVGDNKLLIHVPSGSSEDDEFYYLTITRAEEEQRNVVPRRISSNNSPATGLPTISGTAAVGQTLTASTSDIADANGIENVSFGYQWTRFENDADSDIAGATGSTYTIVTADEGKTLNVRVSFTDDAGNSESRVSTATQAVAAASNQTATGAPTISGTPERTHTLTARTSAITDPDGLTNATFAYQWLRDADTDPVDISGATSSTYTLVADDVGNKISVRVSFTDDAGNSESMASTAVNALEPPPLLGAFDADTVSASHDGETEITFEIYFSVEPSLDFTNVRDHVLTVSNGDVTAVRRINPQSRNKNSRWEITVQPDGDDDITLGLSETTNCTVSSAVCTSTGIMLSNSTSITVPGPGPTNTAATGAPSISGTAQVGETLTADISGISDTDGLTTVSYGYQWIRNDAGTDTDISGQTGSTYTLVSGDAGKTIKVRVSFTDDADNNEALTSAETAVVSATAPGSPGSVDVQPSGTGTLEVTWQAPASSGGSSITGYTIQWKLASGSWDTPTDVSEATATGTTHTITNLELDVEYAVRVIATNSAGDGPTSAESTATPVAESSEQQLATQNSPASGQPAVSGDMLVGETLTVDTSSVADSDGLTNASFSYQWISNDGTADADIQDATGASYTLVAADQGKTIKARVSFTDDAGNDETVTSAATTEVEAALTAELRRVPDSHSGSGTFTFQILFSEPVGVTFRTLKNHSFEVSNGTIQRAQRVDGRNDLRKFTVRPSSSAAVALVLPTTLDCAAEGAVCTSDGKPLSSRLELTVPGPEPSNSAAQGAPTISGTAQVNETLSAGTSGITDANGLDNVSYTYQWIRVDTDSTETDISGATGGTHTLVAADQGKTIKVRVSFTDDASNAETLTSAATAAVSAAALTNTAASGAPVITGTAQVGQTLTAGTSGITDANGLDNASFTYQWIRVNTDSTETGISGATGGTHTLVDADQGKAIKVKVSFTDDAGNDETVTSAATAEVEAALTAELQSVPDAHDGSGTFTFRILFSEPVGVTFRTLKEHSFEVSNGTIQRAQRVNGRNDLRKFTVRPSSSASVVLVLPTTSDCAAEGAICTSAGKPLSSRLELTVPGPEPSNSAAQGAPTISGTAQVDETLTAGTSGITDANGMTNVSYTYQWIRVNTDSTETDISGATGGTHTLVAVDQGKTIKVRVSFTDDASNAETLTSTATAAVSAAPPTNTAASGAPVITGTAQVGQTLTAGTSGITDANGLDNASYTYQWIRVDTDSTETDISGATGGTHTLVATDQGKTIKVRVSFTDDASNAETLTSAATAAVSAAPPTNTAASGAPVITGTAQVGQTLTAGTSAITDANGLDNAAFAYEWLRDAAAIASATSSTYVVAGADEGHAIKVRVSFTDDDDFSESLTSSGLDIPVVPLEGHFDAATVPASHGGLNSTFTVQLYFSVEPALGFVNVRDNVLTLTNGDITKVRRTDGESTTPNTRWELTVQPTGAGAVTIALSPTTDCSADSAVCTSWGKMLSNSASITIAGP